MFLDGIAVRRYRGFQAGGEAGFRGGEGGGIRGESVKLIEATMRVRKFSTVNSEPEAKPERRE